MPRNYVADLPGGSATTSIQAQGAGTIKEIIVSIHDAAAGKVEVSTYPTSQISVVQPTKEVVFRLNLSATAGDQHIVVPVNIPLKSFEYLYVHQTGAGNLGNVSFRL